MVHGQIVTLVLGPKGTTSGGGPVEAGVAAEEPVEVVPGALGMIPHLLQVPGSTLAQGLTLTSTMLITTQTKLTVPVVAVVVEQDHPSPQGCLRRFAVLV
jgi:hypothetical protein